MQLDKFIRPSVGADLSCAPPIYRPGVVEDVRNNLFIFIRKLCDRAVLLQESGRALIGVQARL